MRLGCEESSRSFLCVGSMEPMWIVIKIDCEHTLAYLAIQFYIILYIWKNTSLNSKTIVETYNKCGPIDGVYEDNGDTSKMMCETLEISVEYVYMMIKTHFQKNFHLMQTKTPLSMTSENSHAHKWNLLYKHKHENNTWYLRRGLESIN